MPRPTDVPAPQPPPRPKPQAPPSDAQLYCHHHSASPPSACVRIFLRHPAASRTGIDHAIPWLIASSDRHGIPEDPQQAVLALIIHPVQVDRDAANLDRMIQDIAVALASHSQHLNILQVMEQIPQWHEAIATWPDFDLAKYLALRYGVTPYPQTELYPTGQPWDRPIRSISKANQPRVTRVLRQAGQPLTITQITDRVFEQTPPYQQVSVDQSSI